MSSKIEKPAEYMLKNDVKINRDVAILRQNAKSVYSGQCIIEFVLSASDYVQVSIDGNNYYYTAEYGNSELNANQLYAIKLYTVAGDIPLIKAVNESSFSLLRILNYPSRSRDVE